MSKKCSVRSIYQLAKDIDAFTRDFDPYAYLDEVGDDAEDTNRNIEFVAAEIADRDVEHLQRYLEDIVADHDDESAKKLLNRLIDTVNSLEAEIEANDSIF